MAKIPPSSNNSHPFADQIGDALAPTGTFVATILEIKDEFGVQRQKYESTETEIVDLTCVLFGFRDPQGMEHKVASKRMKISGHENSALFGFLKSMSGHPPECGWDYCELKGSRCLITVEHVQRRDGSGVYAAISSLSPLPSGYGDDAAPQQSTVTPPSGSGAPGSSVSAPEQAPTSPPDGQTTQTAVPMQPSPAPAAPNVTGQQQAPGSARTGDKIPF